MTMMAPMSSTMAIPSSSTFSSAGTRLPSRASTPRANAHVGSHRDAPPGAAGTTEVEGDVQERRDHHAAERTCRRYGCVPR